MDEYDYYFKMPESYKKAIQSMNRMSEHARRLAENSNSFNQSIQYFRNVPFEHIDRASKRMLVINKALEKTINPNIIRQMETIQETVNKLNQSHNQSISGFLKSYDQTRDFVNNYGEYIEDEEELEVIKECKEEFGEMPDIEPTIESFDEAQKEQFKQMITEIYENVLKEAAPVSEEGQSVSGEEQLQSDQRQLDYERVLKRICHTLLTIDTSLSVFIKLPDVPEAIRKYYIMLEVIINIVTG